VNYLIYC